MTGVAVNVTEVPAQMVLSRSLEAIETDGVTDELTIIVIPEDAILLDVKHAAFEVRTQVTISPLFKLLVIKVDELVPVLIPFTFHW